MRVPGGRRARSHARRQTPRVVDHARPVADVPHFDDVFEAEFDDEADMAVRPRQQRRGIVLLPNLITLLALGCGLSAARYAIDGRALLALALIGAAAILDGMDGRIARMLDAQSRMGAELDSLCDAIGFGVTPALVTYYTIVIHATDPRIADLGWVAAITYGACIVLRLARFNTLLTDDTLPTFHKEFFVGVPAPVAALLALVPVVALMHFGPGWWADPVLTSVWLIAVAALAFSRIPTLSLKSTRIKGNLVPLLLIAAVVVIGGILTIPLLVVLVMSVAYLVHIPFAVRTYRWLAATPEAWEVHGRDRRAIRRTARRRRIRL